MLLPILIALIVIVVLAVAVFHVSFFDNNHDNYNNNFMAIITSVIILLVSIVIAFIIRTFAFSKKLKTTQDAETVDLSHNIAICDCCGRYFKFSELKWKLNNDVNAVTKSSDSGSHTHYTGSISVSETCPKCKTRSGTSIIINLGEDSSEIKHIIFTDSDKITTSSKRNSIDPEKTVKNVFDKNMKDAKSTVKEYSEKGYVIDYVVKTKSSKQTQPKSPYSKSN